MTARERGVRVPPVILARGNDRGAVVVQEYVRGRPLDDLSADERDPRPAAREVWQQVALLRAARIAHHDLVASSVLVDDDGRPWVVDFGNAVDRCRRRATWPGTSPSSWPRSRLRVDAGPVVDVRAVRARRRRPRRRRCRVWRPLSRSAVTRAEERVRSRSAERPAPRGPAAARAARPTTPGVPARRAPSPAWLVGPGAVAGPGGAPPDRRGDRRGLESVEVGGWRWLGGAVVLAVPGPGRDGGGGAGPGRPPARPRRAPSAPRWSPTARPSARPRGLAAARPPGSWSGRECCPGRPQQAIDRFSVGARSSRRPSSPSARWCSPLVETQAHRLARTGRADADHAPRRSAPGSWCSPGSGSPVGTAAATTGSADRSTRSACWGSCAAATCARDPWPLGRASWAGRPSRSRWRRPRSPPRSTGSAAACRCWPPSPSTPPSTCCGRSCR